MKGKIRDVVISSFLKGMGSTLDLTPVSKRKIVRNIYLESDAESLSKDWHAVGKDFNKAFGNYGGSFKRKTI